mgnify:CR=1 FL=1
MELALFLLVVGMVSVFAVLFIVVFVGNAIILVVNKFVPAEVIPVKKQTTQTITTAIASNKLAAISAAVELVTQGKGRVVDVKKI